MPTSNISQVLLRNSELLSANNPLFINLMADDFIDRYLDENPNATVNCYNTNYIDHMAINNKYNDRVALQFNSEYQTDLKHDLVIINFPKSKDELTFTFAMIAPYLREGAKIILVGEKKGGVQSSPKLAQDFLQHCQKIDAARHCLVFAGIVKSDSLNKIFNIDNWFKKYQLCVGNVALTVASLPGVFSQKKLDVGTALLLNNLPEIMQGKVLDFGCGAGVISCFIGKKHPNTHLSLLDVSALAIRSAEETLALNNLSGNVFPSNSLSMVKDHYQHIVSNPPFHQGTKTNYQATEEFLKGISHYMAPQSNITIVANSFLQYQPIMQQHIGKTDNLTSKQGFTIYYSQLN